MFAAHVVSACQDVAHRRAPQDEIVVGIVLHSKSQVGVTASDQIKHIRAAGAFNVCVEPGGDVSDIDTGMVVHYS